MHCVFGAKLRTLCLALGPGDYFELFLNFVVLCSMFYVHNLFWVNFGNG